MIGGEMGFGLVGATSGLRTSARRWMALAPLLVALVAGCAQQPTRTSGDADYANLFGAGSGVAYATEAPVGSAAEAMAKGDLALAGGDSDRALYEYVRALNLEADQAEAFYKIGAIHAARGNDAVAETAYRRALAVDGGHAPAMTGLGILLTRKRDYAEAGNLLSAAIRKDPKLAGAHNALGVLADVQGEHELAQLHFNEGLALAPKSAILRNNLGYSFYLAGKPKAAIKEFRKALEINPGYAMAWRNLGLVYSRQGRYEEALAAFAKVQDKPKAYNDVGYIAMVAGRLDEAESFFEEAKRLSPEFYPTATENAERVKRLKGK